MLHMLRFVQAHRHDATAKLSEIRIKKPSVMNADSKHAPSLLLSSIQHAIDEYSPHFQALNWTLQQMQDRKKDKYLVLRKLL
mmetsp:Transcript_29657/g.47231  ORF Transcript_29657/g.47231 Transcript_29657/m.47231 type:complete len:82 (-) Transcript_29657:171-416(-)